MPGKKRKQIRISGISRAGIRVFSAMDVPLWVRIDNRWSAYLEFKGEAERRFHRKHPGARITEIRTITFKEEDEAW